MILMRKTQCTINCKKSITRGPGALTHEGFLNSHDLCWNVAVMLSGQRWVRCYLAVSNAMKWNKWGSTPHLYTYRLNWVRRIWVWWDEWGVTALQTQDSKLSPVGLRPSTLTLGHGGCPQYSIFTIEQGGNILFLWNLNARAGDESAISDCPSRHQDPPPRPSVLLLHIYKHITCGFNIGSPLGALPNIFDILFCTTY